MNNKPDHKYRVIAKITGKKADNGNDQCVKYGTSDLISFTDFLDRKYPEWCWFNVFRYVRGGKGERLASFTKYKRPTTRSIEN